MIIWRGRGYWVAILVFFSSLVANLITDQITHDSNYYDNNSWLVGFALWVAAILVWLMVKYVPSEKNRKVMDLETGEHFIIDNSRDALFFINMKYWPLILLVIGVFSIGSHWV